MVSVFRGPDQFGEYEIRFSELDMEHNIKAKKLLVETIEIPYTFPNIIIGNRFSGGSNPDPILASLKECKLI